MGPIKDIFEQATAWVGHDAVWRVVESVMLLTLYFVLRLTIRRTANSLVKQPEKQFQILKYSHILLNLILVVAVFQIWLNRSLSIASFIGLISAGLAIVLREPLLNLAGWIFILSRRPFSIGERVQIGDGCAGDVVDIGLNDFSVMEVGNWVGADQSTGRLIHVPNSVVFTKEVANYHRGFPFLWNELVVVITFESDLDKAEAALQSIAHRVCGLSDEAQEAIREDLRQIQSVFISFTHLTPIVYLAKVDHGVRLTLRYLCAPRQRRSTESQLWKAIFEEFARSDSFRFAYPTQRLLLHEGQRDVRATEEPTGANAPRPADKS